MPTLCRADEQRAPRVVAGVDRNGGDASCRRRIETTRGWGRTNRCPRGGADRRERRCCRDSRRGAWAANNFAFCFHHALHVLKRFETSACGNVRQRESSLPVKPFFALADLIGTVVLLTRNPRSGLLFGVSTFHSRRLALCGKPSCWRGSGAFRRVSFFLREGIRMEHQEKKRKQQDALPG